MSVPFVDGVRLESGMIETPAASNSAKVSDTHS